MSDITIEKTDWETNNEIWIKSGGRDQSFEITLAKGKDIEIEFEWDHGYGGRGTGSMSIPHEILVKLIKEIY